MEQWLEEVLYRGRPPNGVDSDKSPIFHVVIGVQADDPLTPGAKIRKLLGPMNPQDAEQLGFSLPKLLEEINLDMTKRVSELTPLEKINVELTKRISELEPLEEMNRTLTKHISELTSALAKEGIFIQT